MCDFLNENSSSQSTDSDSNDLKQAFTILEVEVNKSALNLAVSSEETSSCSTSVGEIELKICPEFEDFNSRKDENEEKETCLSKDQLNDGDSVSSPEQSEKSLEDETNLEYTLAIIMPEALIYKKEIERLMTEENFNICQTRWLQLTPEQVSDFYFDNYEQEAFAQLVTYMSSNPIIVYVISKSNAIEDWKKLIGPENIADARIYAPDSIRGKYGRVENEMGKIVHGSDDKRSAEKEIKYFFPNRKIEPAPREEAGIKYLWNEVNETLTEALVKCCEEKPADPIVWLGNWLLDYKTNTPKYLLRY